MGKIKKGRRGAKEEDSSSDVEIETQENVDAKNSKKTKNVNKKAVEVASDGETNEKVVKKKKGKAQKSKKHEDTDSDEPEDAAPKNGKNKQDKRKTSDGEIEKSTKASNKKSSKHKKDQSDESDNEQVPISKVAKSFALLEVDSDHDVDSDNEIVSDSEVTQTVKKDNKKNVKESEVRTKEGKKSKKSRRKRDDSDDDIDKALAELALEHGIETDTKPKEEEAEIEQDENKDKTKKKTKRDKEEVKTEGVTEEEEEHGSTVKTAAQKKKEKKEREKLKKKQDVVTKVESSVPVEEVVVTEELQSVAPADGEDAEKDSKKKKKKGAKVVEEKDAKKGPNKKMIQQMQEALRKTQEEQDRLQREEDERIRKEEEAEDARLEALRIEKERKEKKKQREKERKERLKAEGKFLTAKQKADRARAQAMIDNLKAQGLELPDVGEKKPRLGTRIKPSRVKPQKSIEKEVEKVEEKPEEKVEEPKVEEEIVEEVAKESDNDVKDAWDASSSEEEESEETPAGTDKKTEAKEDSEDSTDESSEEDSEEEEEGDHKTDAEKRKERAKARIEQRKIDAEKNRTLDNLRAAVVCVLGHVDTGKTKILDKLRRTNVQDGEAGGITQQIGATNVPIDAIREQIKHVKSFANMEFKLPGLLIIDTPGHESFSNLRSRGSSLCDIAILVVDIMHGLEPQTIESLNLLKNKKTPFVVALNKVDRLYDWQTMNRRDVSDIIKGQAPNTQLEFEQRKNEVIVQFAEQGLNAALCYENPDERSYVSLVPTSAVTGEGMGNLLSLIVDHCQNRLTKRLMFSEDLQATVLEVKAIPGLGTTIDAILINGTLREGDTMILAGTEGPITTQIRSLLMPQPMKELRVKNAYVEYKSIQAAQGVKIAAKELEKSIAGLNLYIAQHPDEVELVKEVVAKELKSALSGIKLQERGVYVQASTLGSLEALLEFLRTSKIPYSGIRIGPVVKKDVMKASIMLEHDSQYATILAFDVKIERDAQELADNLGVRIFQADIIYHLFDKFMAYTAELKAKKREEFKNIAVFPCKLRILPQFVFNSRDPIVVGVIVENGIVKEGTPICVPSKEFVEIGIVTGLEVNHKNVESARKGMEVCVKIEPIPGESPKMFGRHFDDKDFLISKISRQSIDACKDHFRDDLTKTDWALMVELKKMFQIL